MNNQTHYVTLSIDRCASCAEVKRAYRTLAHRFHPDVSQDADGERKFKEIAAAYRALKRPESRVAYDLQIHNVCSVTKSIRLDDFPAIGVFSGGLMFFRYWQWFWAIGSAGDKK